MGVTAARAGAWGAEAGVEVVALAVLAVVGAARVAAAGVAGLAGVLRAGVGLLVAAAVLAAGAGAEGAGEFLTTGVFGATGTAGAFGVVVFLVTILLSSAMGDQSPPNYDARPVSEYYANSSPLKQWLTCIRSRAMI